MEENNFTEEKLQLEIEGLRQKNAWDNSVGKWIPVITAAIAVCGFLGGIIGYVIQQRQMEAERATAAAKLENERKIAEDKRQKDMDEASRAREERESEARRTFEENRATEEKRLSANRQIADNQLAAEQRNLLMKLAADQKLEAKRQETQQTSLRTELVKANEARTFESQRPYREKQIELYFEASRAAATLATSPSLNEKLGAEEKFWNLYWGPLSVVEDTLSVKDSANTEVEKAMVIFGRCSPLGQGSSDRFARSSSKITFELCSTSELEQRSLCLAHTIRDAIYSTWGIGGMRMGEEERERCSRTDPYPKPTE